MDAGVVERNWVVRGVGLMIVKLRFRFLELTTRCVPEQKHRLSCCSSAGKKFFILRQTGVPSGWGTRAPRKHGNWSLWVYRTRKRSYFTGVAMWEEVCFPTAWFKAPPHCVAPRLLLLYPLLSPLLLWDDQRWCCWWKLKEDRKTKYV